MLVWTSRAAIPPPGKPGGFSCRNFMACGLGAGLGCGSVCGAVTSGVLVVGLKYGNTQPDDKISRKCCIQKTKEFLDTFKAKFNTIICRELHKPALLPSGTQSPISSNNPKCAEIIATTIKILEELGY